MSSFLYKKSGMEFSSIPESVYPENSDWNFRSLLFYSIKMFFRLLLIVLSSTQKGSQPKGQALVPKHMTIHLFPYLVREE